MTHSEIERQAYIKGDLMLADYAQLADEQELEIGSFDDQLEAKFEEGKLEASEPALISEIAQLNLDLQKTKEKLAYANRLIDVTCKHLNEGNLNTIKDRKAFEKSLRADQLRNTRA